MTTIVRLIFRRGAAKNGVRWAWNPLRIQRSTLIITAAILALSAAACDGTPTWYLDATVGEDGPPPRPEAGTYPDGAIGSFASVTLTGCAELSITETTTQCSGQAPLEIAFSTLAPQDTQSFVWDFGDGSEPGSTSAPVHTYHRPGTYIVDLVVGGPFGPISPTRGIQITVREAPLGDWCDRDEQCQSGTCLCADASEQGCPSVLSGTCTGACPACGADGICADLTAGDATDLPAWRAPHCLAACAQDVDCPRAGFRCRAVPTRDATGARDWQGACLPDVLGDVGQPCLDADGAPDPEQCLSGDCADLGRFGLCTDACDQSPCPGYAACAVLSGGPRSGEPLCLARCSASRPCDADPALSCTAPDALGELGFTLLSATEPAGATYCAPRRCAGALDCPSGQCDLAAGGFCR